MLHGARYGVTSPCSVVRRSPATRALPLAPTGPSATDKDSTPARPVKPRTRAGHSPTPKAASPLLAWRTVLRGTCDFSAGSNLESVACKVDGCACYDVNGVRPPRDLIAPLAKRGAGRELPREVHRQLV